MLQIPSLSAIYTDKIKQHKEFNRRKLKQDRKNKILWRKLYINWLKCNYEGIGTANMEIDNHLEWMSVLVYL